jgi:hypothetical protein
MTANMHKLRHPIATFVVTVLVVIGVRTRRRVNRSCSIARPLRSKMVTWDRSLRRESLPY